MREARPAASWQEKCPAPTRATPLVLHPSLACHSSMPAEGQAVDLCVLRASLCPLASSALARCVAAAQVPAPGQRRGASAVRRDQHRRRSGCRRRQAPNCALQPTGSQLPAQPVHQHTAAQAVRQLARKDPPLPTAHPSSSAPSPPTGNTSSRPTGPSACSWRRGM